MSWYTVYVPLNLVLNAAVGGPILAIAGLRAAGYERIEGRFGRVLAVVAAVALAANVVSFGMQSADLPAIENSFVTAAQLVPSYGLMIGRSASWAWRASVRTSPRCGARPASRSCAQPEPPCWCWAASSSCGSRST
ncbi:DmsC/YnfH family molybdoenzyme membrane anchor subunit [Eggerthella sinensis]|uniref:DmsC/YnfH family molybdoenzyme membrane anchor subunit n=1 Tax=Eggerthella sinensis TaxID=242230 RepID=UPI0022E636D4|nr:DmsC/YnfH family molybdoenzyme membrane anchor subunit [Eggerthella sinensis]